MKGFSAFMYREWTLFARSKLDIGLSLLPSLVMLIFFSFNMAGAVGQIRGIPYVHFLIPGLATMALTYNAVSAASRTFNEGFSFMFQELFSLPATRAAYIYAKIIATMLLATIHGVVFLLGASLIFRFNFSIRAFVFSSLILLLTAFGVVGLFLCIALLTKEMSTFLVISNVFGQVLIWTSTVFYPSQNMPTLFRWISLGNPLSHSTDILRTIYFNERTNISSWIFLLVFALFCGLLASRLLANRISKLS